MTFDWWVKRKTKQSNEFTIRKNNYRSFLIDCSFVDCFIHVRCSATPAPWLDKLSTESYKETTFFSTIKTNQALFRIDFFDEPFNIIISTLEYNIYNMFFEEL